MYPSDYGFSLNKVYWNELIDSVSKNSWLYNSIYGWVWLISPSSTYKRAFAISPDLVSARDATDNYNNVLPTLYLKSNVKITKGDGTSSNPFLLGL